MANTDTSKGYLFSIDDWTINYGFSIGVHHDPPAPYWEHLALEIQTSGVAPERIRDRSFLFRLTTDREIDSVLLGAEHQSDTPIGIGELTSRADRNEVVATLPHSTALWLLPALESLHIRSILLRGGAIKWGRAQITSIHFATALDPGGV